MKLNFILIGFFIVLLVRRDVDGQATCATNGRIVFSSDRDGQFEIYTINPDGTDLQRLTQNDSADLAPSWSPDGKQIAFSSDVAPTFYGDIFVMNADGSNIINLTNTPQQNESFPIWSSDGKKIAFSRPIMPVETAIFVMNADGMNVTQITDEGNEDNVPASWSPDGTQIAFISSRGQPIVRDWDTVFSFYRMKPDGTEVNLIPYGGKEFGLPDWSPDNKTVLFHETGGFSVNIATMNLSTSVLTWITADDIDDRYPRWSPDGEKIVFTRDRDIAVMDATGDNPVILTDEGEHTFINTNPDWQPIPCNEPSDIDINH